jgi:predicted secreted protein
MTAYVGRDVVVEFAPGLETVDPATLTFKTLGMMRTKTVGGTWDTADTTADSSPDYTRTSLVTFKSFEFSGDGVTYSDDIYNQKEFRSAVLSPTVATNYQPKIWLKLTFPDEVIQGPFIVSEFSTDAPFDDAVTWSTSAASNGAVTFTPV